jgi:hypothetical protein
VCWQGELLYITSPALANFLKTGVGWYSQSNQWLHRCQLPALIASRGFSGLSDHFAVTYVIGIFTGLPIYTAQKVNSFYDFSGHKTVKLTTLVKPGKTVKVRRKVKFGRKYCINLPIDT